MLVRIYTPTGTTGLVLCNNVCIAAPKRFRHLLKKTAGEIKEELARQSFQATIVKRHPDRKWRR